MKLHQGTGKYVFKRAMEPYLPKDVLYRPKMGFGVPLAAWFRGPLKDRVRDAVLGPSMRDLGWLDLNTIARMVDQHQSGARDHSSALWSLMMFEASLRVLTGNRADAEPEGMTAVVPGAASAGTRD